MRIESTHTPIIMKKDSFANQQLPGIFRAIIAFMFLLSAVSKLYPSPYFAMTTFEIKQLVPLGFNETVAAYFSRILIGCELALGFLLLQKHFIKQLVVPAAFLMLFVFSVHLTYDLITKGNDGNCGCFGSLLPMSPLQALIKNIIGMAMLVFVFMHIKPEKRSKNLSFIVAVTTASVLLIFLLGPIAKTTSMEPEGELEYVEEEFVVDTASATVDEKEGKDTLFAQAPKSTEPTKTTTTVQVEKPTPVLDEPKAKKSGFATIYADIDKGRKILCFYAPGCDHCKETAKELHEMSKTIANFPEMKIVFMDEEAELIPDFFTFSGQKLTYKIFDVAKFWTTLGGDKDTPGVFYFWNGNLVKNYDGIGPKAFKKDDFKKVVQKKWSELK
jgi:thiol-disulfide isomerase/thioredoxin